MDPFQGLIDPKTRAVLTVFLKHPKKQFHIHMTAQKADVSITSTFRIIKQLVDLNILEIHTFSKFKVYQLSKNKKTSLLRRLL